MTDEERQDDAQQEAGPAAAPAEDEPADVDGLRKRLEEEKERAQQHFSSWQRSAADFQNLKRRMEHERGEVARLANVSLVINLLPLMDDLERALRNVDTKLAGLTWIDGIWLIQRKFEAVLENAGVKEIQADSQPFDPQVHEAISEAPGEVGRVVSVVQKGYQLGDRVIRPAMVIVGKAEAEEQGTRNQEQEGEEKAGAGGEDNNTEGQASA
ncbi:MAG: nucleotide exchange factor GrpE [Chloroflexi bacterium]|nr:nucleotide exchange factor GrpE [Chloroflexota bacterium]